MWIICMGVICGIGETLRVIDNMGQIGDALGFSLVDVSTFVSLISIWNFLARVVVGFLSKFLLKYYNFPKPLILTTILVDFMCRPPLHSISNSKFSLCGIHCNRFLLQSPNANDFFHNLRAIWVETLLHII
jgi:hypothetical protein